ncbi:unnamed protein product [Lupinus luteus]|uniref:DUF4378 domain-containing protein n=1 Tax=Lupinus luteus TaxID=3873 RepID=A0AAV1XIU8_LUPLU
MDDKDVQENDNEEDGFNLECSYANVQTMKRMVLIWRFEQLVELDPSELEKRMLNHDEYEYETFTEDECEDDDFQSLCKEKELRELIFEILCHSSVHDRRHVPEDYWRLVSDLIMEEEREVDSLENRNMVIRRVCRRLELWKEVDSNTIDMMIEEDFSGEECGWKKNAMQIVDLVGEFELSILGFLVEEFSEEFLLLKKSDLPWRLSSCEV